MTFDPLNMPFERSAPTLTSSDTAGAELKAESILLEEFNYAGVSAYQAREDSAALINMYLVATGALATGLGVMASANTGAARPTISLIAIASLAIFALLSFAFFARFLGLEQEYREGILAMDVIKEYYIQRLRRSTPDIELAFRWRLRKHPRGATLAGGAPLIAWTIALLGSLGVAGALGEARQLASIINSFSAPYAHEPVLGLSVPYFWEILAGLLMLAAHGAYYLVVARRRRARTVRDATSHAERIAEGLARHGSPDVPRAGI